MVEGCPEGRAGAECRTRREILDAAGEIFAERGYRGATVRDICERAGANIAAVAYHFGGKEGLYREVLRHGRACAEMQHPLEMEGLSPEEQLRVMCRTFMRRILLGDHPSWQGKLMAREMVEPTPALDEVVRTMVRPQYERMCGIVAALLGEGAPAEQVKAGALSVLGQMLLYRHGRHVLERLFPRDGFTPASVDARADRICEFSLIALRGLRKEGGA